MNKMNKSAIAAAISIGLAIPTVPAMAFPSVPVKADKGSGLTDVQHRVERRGDRHYWRGHRGYRERRPGYRYRNGFWFPPAAFAAGALIGGAIAAGRAAATDDDHEDWCRDRYRSYRASDNTYAIGGGARRECASPYMR